MRMSTLITAALFLVLAGCASTEDKRDGADRLQQPVPDKVPPIANAALLGIEEFEDYYAYVRMYVHPRFPGRMLVDLDIPREPRVRGCFCVNPATKKLEKLLDKPLVHFV